MPDTAGRKLLLYRILALFAAAALFALVAFCNGYPLVYHDTGLYLLSSHELYVPADRPIFYGLFLRLARGFSNSNWTAVWAQGLVLAYLNRALMQAAAPGHKLRSYFAVCFILALGTSLPWASGQLMPDVWAAALGLALFLLFYPTEPGAPFSRAILVTIVFVAMLVHLSHFAICILMLVLLAIFGRYRAEFRASGFRWVLVAWIAVLPTTWLTNYCLNDNAVFPKTGHLSLIGPLVRDGIVQQLLAERCPEAGYALCAHQEALRGLKGDGYTWNLQSPLYAIGGREGSAAESWRIIADAARFLPGTILRKALEAWGRQFLDFRTGDGLKAYPATDPVTHFISQFHPEEAESFRDSRQQLGLLLEEAASANWLHLPLACLGFLIVGLALVFRKTKPHDSIDRFSVFVLFFLTVNAAVCGILAGPLGRYQSRVVWLVVLAAILVLIREARVFFRNPIHGNTDR